jgi:hypothetical protein
MNALANAKDLRRHQLDRLREEKEGKFYRLLCSNAGADVMAEAKVTYKVDLGHATISFEGHRPIHAQLNKDNGVYYFDGVVFTVPDPDGKSRYTFKELIEAAMYAETKGV